MTSVPTQVTAPGGCHSGQPGAPRHRLCEFGDLGPAEIDRWLEIRASNPSLDSPYFHPGFAAAVADGHPGVRVVVTEDARGTVTSFLPVQRDGRTWHPAGFPAADFQGPICAPDAGYDIVAAVSRLGARSYEFDHMRDGLPAFEPWTWGREQSPYIDVSGGLPEYLERASRSGKDNMAQARRRARKAEREYGPIEFVAESGDATVLDAVIELKRRQYRATGSRDYFSDRRHVDLAHRLLGERRADFGGILSALYAGPELLAAHFGLRAGPVLHWWFPVYDPRFSRLAPGWLLLRALVQAAPELGLTRIDLGRGGDEYKRRAMTGYQIVGQGAVTPNPVRRRAMVNRRRAVAALKASRLAPVARAAVHYVRRRSR